MYFEPVNRFVMARSMAGMAGASSLTKLVKLCFSLTVVVGPVVTVCRVTASAPNCRGQDKAFTQLVKARLLHQPLRVLGITHPHEVLSHLELHFIVATEVLEKLT